MRRILILLSLGLAVAACSTDGSLDGDWQLTSGTSGDQAIPISESHPITITFGDGQMSGSGGCNQYSGTFELAAKSISFGPIAITERACLEDDIMQAESLYGITLSEVTTFSVDGDELTLTGPAGTLAFSRT